MVRRWLCLCVVAVALGACGQRADSPLNSPKILLLPEDIYSFRDANPAQIQFLLEQEIRSRIDASLTQLEATTPTAITPPTPTPATPAVPATTEAVPVAAEPTDEPDIMDANMPVDEVLPDEVLPDEVLPDAVLPDEVSPEQVLPSELVFDSLAQFSIAGHLSLECVGICQDATLNGDIAIAVDTDRRSFALENIHLQDIDAQFFLRGNVKRFWDNEQIVADFLAEADLLLETPHEHITLDTDATLTIDAIPQSQSDDAYGLIEVSHGDSNTFLFGDYSSLSSSDGG